MESGQFEGYCYRGIGNAHYIRDEPRNGIGERIEQNQHPDHTEYIKGKMCQSRPSGLRITGQSRQVGRNRCSYIFTQYECHTQLVVDPPLAHIINVMAIVAAEACTIMVRIAPINKNRMIEKNPISA